MRLTPDEAALILDHFSEFIFDQVGEDVVYHRGADKFSVEVLRPKARKNDTKGQIRGDDKS